MKIERRKHRRRTAYYIVAEDGREVRTRHAPVVCEQLMADHERQVHGMVLDPESPYYWREMFPF